MKKSIRNGSNATRKRTSGMTLIELMIVVAVVGILAALAYPSYQEQVRKTRRADGKAMLMETAQKLERCYTRFATYNNVGCNVTLPATSPEGWYDVDGTVNASTFTLDATPLGDQLNDAKCGALRFTSTGLQGALGTNEDANNCW